MPTVLLARSVRPHVSLGQSQCAADELDLAACAREQIEVVRRPLGGGTVLVDAFQLSVFFVVPAAIMSIKPREFIERCLAPMVGTYRHFGIPAGCVAGTDIWCQGAKLAGSGAATIGSTLVFGSSFVERFDHDLFCRVVFAPSDGFRAWLRSALGQGLKAWSAFAPVPEEKRIGDIFRRQCELAFGWQCIRSRLQTAEQTVTAEVREALRSDEWQCGERRVRHGIKINAHTYLVETGGEEDWLRLLIEGGRIVRIAAADPHVSGRLQCCRGITLDADTVRSILVGAMTSSDADRWTRRIRQTAAYREGE